MQIYSNVIRFPVVTPTPERANVTKEKTDNVVDFPTTPTPDAGHALVRASSESREHGQWFAAQRIVARVADQLDQIAAL